MQEKLPYYMTYPMTSFAGENRQDQRDMEYIKSLYPNTVKRMLLYVEDECDRMELEGSMMYDEFPDPLQMQMICNRIYDKVKDMDENEKEMVQQEVEAQQRRDSRRRRDDPLRDIVQILFFQELLRRRGDRRRSRLGFF